MIIKNTIIHWVQIVDLNNMPRTCHGAYFSVFSVCFFLRVIDRRMLTTFGYPIIEWGHSGKMTKGGPHELKIFIMPENLLTKVTFSIPSTSPPEWVLRFLYLSDQFNKNRPAGRSFQDHFATVRSFCNRSELIWTLIRGTQLIWKSAIS